ncbi:MAG: peptide ABC transporter permease, partial [Salaquimonas sp.]
MFGFILKRIGLLIPTFIGITIVAFTFVRILPGDPVLLMAGERGLTPERHQQLLQEFGYDRPIWEQYLDYLGKLLSGDLGNSIVTKQPVLGEFFTLFPATVE